MSRKAFVNAIKCTESVQVEEAKTGLLVIREETEELKNAAEAAEGSLEEHGKSVGLLKLLDVKREF